MVSRHVPPHIVGATRWLVLGLLLAAGACSSPPAPPRPDEAPVANAGPDQDVQLGSLVTLDGSASSDPEGQPLTYAWSAGADNPGSVVLTATSVVRFAPPAAGDYEFILVVTAGGVASEPDTVQLQVLGGDNDAPVAVAGPDYAAPLGAAFFLDGSASRDADGDSLSLRWEVSSAPGAVSIDDSTAVQTSITPTVAGSYTFRLQVTDGAGLSAEDEITILVTSQGNTAPVADAGPPQTVSVGTVVTLDGSASYDPDGDALTYRWSVGNNPGDPVSLSDTTAARPQFTPNLLGQYVFGLVVHDGESVSLLDTTVVIVVTQTYARRAGMIEIPGGPFVMGTDAGQADEAPTHTVDISTFWVDSVEVTTSQYTLCVNAGDCSLPAQRPGCNFGLTERAEHPINCVDYQQAVDFCGWAGKRLPTEAEWEKVARGPNDQRRFPWGDDDPNLYLITYPEAQLLNFNNNLGTTAPVGQYADGVSPYGVHNLAGNVYEWVADWYAPDAYSASAVDDPQGPATGEQRVARGGHYLAPSQAVTTTVRNSTQPATRVEILGFRCARTAPP